MGPDCTAGGNGGGAHRYPPHRDVRGDEEASPRCPSPHRMRLQKQQCFQSSPENQQQQHPRALSSSNPGSPLMYTVCPATPDRSMNPYDRASPLYRSHASPHSRLGDSASPSSAMTEAGMYESNSDLSAVCPTWFNRCAASSPSLSSVMASRHLPPLQAHSPDPQSRCPQPFNSIAAAVSYSSPLGVASNESPHMKTALTSFGEASWGGLTSPNSNRGGMMASAPQQQSLGNCRSNVGHVMLPEEVSHPSKLAQSGMLNSSPSHSGGAGPARVSGASPYQCALDGLASQQQEKQQQSTLERYAPGNVTTPVGASSSAAAGGASPGSVPTGDADADKIVPRQHGDNNSLALNSSLEERLPTTAASVPHRHTSPSSVSWPRDAFASSPFSRDAPPSSHLHPRAAISPARESTPVMPLKTSPKTTSTPLRVDDSAPGGVEADCFSEARGSRASPPRPHAFSQHQSPEKGFIDSQSTGTPHPQPQPIHPLAPTSSSPQALKSPAMFGVIDLSYSRTDASGSNATPPMPTGATGVGASAVVKTRTQVRTPSRAPAVISVRVPVPSLPSNNSTPATSVNHADPTAAAASLSSTSAAATAVAPLNGGSSCSELTAHSGTTILRMVHSAGQRDSSYSTLHTTLSHSRDATTATATTTATTTPGYSPRADSQTPVHTATIASQHGTLFTPLSPLLAESDDDAVEAEQQQQQRKAVQSQQHMKSVASTALMAARVRKTAVSSPTVSVDAVRKPERSSQALTLTADTVLPVAVQEDEARCSSSAATTATRSSSNSRAQLSSSASLSRSINATTLTEPKGGTAGVAASGTGRLERVRTVVRAGSVSARNVASRERGPREKFAATFAASSSFSSKVAAAASSASASSMDMGAVAGARGAHVRRQTSVSTASTSSVASDMLRAPPALASYSFVSSRAQMQRYIDQWRDRFEEDKNAYKEGGYLTVTPGRIVHSRYVLIQKLGWGEFSTVWLGYDTKHATLGRGLSQAFVAVKVAKCRSNVQEATRYEVSLLRYLEARLPRHAAITNIIDCFDVRGEFGMHTCMVLPLCGPNLLSIIERMKADRSRRNAEDLRMIKEIVLSVLISLHELSELNVVHTDIKPENVLCSAVDSKLVNSMEKFCIYNQERSHMISVEDFKKSMAQQSTEHLVYLADFGLSALLEPPGSAQLWMSACSNVDASLLAPLMRCKKNFPVTRSGVVDNHRGTLIQTREYRAPEVLLGLDFTCTTDVWSVGCMTFELITGCFLMDPKRKTREPRDMDIEHLAMMMQILGPLPSEITSIRVRNNDYYDAIIQGTPVPKSGFRPPPEYLHRFVDRNGKFIYASRYHSYPRRNLEMELEPYLGFREAQLAANFILSCLHSYDPKKRPSAKKLLSHQWLYGVGAASKEKTPSR
ncbi:protein kinase [Leishmania donovani]|uniref:non-specific serine/threonine protein kinase n=2 Tax=Leishmania donovani TaxID=5661 RepID=A0A504XSM1_LEIDO|nr:Protein kinase domain family protein [Leishmania donovani]CAJ1989683.1 protein kinase [Leishmania donovani]